MSNHKFQTEVSQLLHLIIHSLYSHKEIFLRELISNSSDALDKLKYLTLTDDTFKSLEFTAQVNINFNEKDKTLTISDSGIGMNKDDLKDNLGTIARSGTKNFVEILTGDSKKDSNLIGQFGVGFYSSYMVADKVEVISKKAGENTAFKWTSDGKSGYKIEDAEKDTFGTDIILQLNEEGEKYLNRWEIQNIVKKYSNHIPFPIYLHWEEITTKGEGDKKKEKKENKTEQINAGSAFWKKSKGSLKEKDYNQFYQSIAVDYEDPILHIHTQAEGTLDYTTLFYVPKNAPFDLFNPDFQPGVKLYVKRVFITDNDKELMPTYLRFIRGVIDSEDLPLNVSREILQKNRVLAKIKNNSVKKILSELLKYSEDKKKYTDFIDKFGIPIKEGLYQDHDNRDDLLELVRFKSTTEDGYVSLAEYASRIKTDQKAIYYIVGDDEATLKNSPLLEMYNEKEIEVLIMDQDIDEFVIPTINKYKEHDLKSVNFSDAAEELKTDEDKKEETNIKPLLKKMKKVLGEQVKDVTASSRLKDSPSCIVADSNDPTAKMQELMRAMGQPGQQDIKPILEINPSHAIIIKLKNMKKSKSFDDISQLLLDQAVLLEGAKLKNPTDFVDRLNTILTESL
ncbi:MAG TPA: molecular chaperone HtpG [Candidatus Marinimicrobia bacterium]|nr:molecular chaperone HtpG [Candidatus Neomarinimicrobiota bacterium]